MSEERKRMNELETTIRIVSNMRIKCYLSIKRVNRNEK